MRPPRHHWVAAGLGALGLVLPAPAARLNAASPPAADRGPQAGDPIRDAVAEAALRFALPEAWLRAVIRVESAGNPQAVSAAGALGLMQIMPRTFADQRARLGLGADPFAVRDNVLAGADYLRRLYDRYGAPGFLAAYNAGPARWEDHLITARPLPRETLAYIAKLAPGLGLAHADGPAIPAPSPLFVRLDRTRLAPRNRRESPGIRTAPRLGITTEPSAVSPLTADGTGDLGSARGPLFAPTVPSARAVTRIPSRSADTRSGEPLEPVGARGRPAIRSATPENATPRRGP